MKEQLQKLGVMRQVKDQFDDEWRTLQAAFEEEHSELLRKRTDASNDINTVSEEIRTLALDQYETTNVKDFEGGVKIKLFKTMGYDNALAEAWAKENATMCFVFNTKTFEKIVKANPSSCPVATIGEEARVQIPSKIEVTK